MPPFTRYDKNLKHSYCAGVFPCFELLKYRPEIARALIYSSEALRGDGFLQLLERCKNLNIYTELAPRALERVYSGGVTCAMMFDKFECELAPKAPHVVLYGIEDMGNLGTALRTLLGFGFTNTAIITPAADHFAPRAVRASMGALFAHNIAAFNSFEDYLAANGKEREIYYFRLQNAGPLSSVTSVSDRFTLVFGAESSGLPQELLSGGNGVIIPHGNAIDSLNLAVSVGIGAYHFSNIMQKEKIDA